MQKKQGFLLIELIIGMGIAMAITVLLINTLQQTQKARTTLDDYVYVYTQAAIIYHQLERDLITAFAPDIIPVPPEKNSPENNSSQTADKANSQGKNKETDESEKKEKQKTFEKPFYATQKNKNLDVLTLITTSPLSTYWTSKTGPIKARMARVIYQLKKDPLDNNIKSNLKGNLNNDSYTLYRKEGQNLNFKTYTSDASSNTTANTGSNTGSDSSAIKDSKIHEYPIIKNIKTCAVTYEVVIEQEETDQKNNNPENKTDNTDSDTNKKQEYKTFTSWDQEESPDQTSNQELNKKDGVKSLPRLPHTVTVNLVLWNRKRNREFPFTFTYSIAWHDDKIKNKDKKTGTNTPANTKTVTKTNTKIETKTLAYTNKQPNTQPSAKEQLIIHRSKNGTRNRKSLFNNNKRRKI